MRLIESKITDRKLTKLIWKTLTAGYFEFKVYKNNVAGTPQGSIVSPLLANIFLHELDVFILDLKSKFDKGTRPKRIKAIRYYEYHITKARKNGDFELERKLIAERSQNRATEVEYPGYRRLSYVRYADDWVVGIRGTHKETLDILKKIKEFCEQLGLKVSDQKTKVTNIIEQDALFLGTKITREKHRSYSSIGPMKMLRRNKLGLRFEAPLDIIRKKLSNASFMKNGKSAPKFLWLHNDHDQIILLYNSVLRGFLNYYSFVHNYSRLATYLEYILKQSCAKLLTAKFSLGTMMKTYKKFGSSLSGPKGKAFLKPSYKVTGKFLVNPSPMVGAYVKKRHKHSRSSPRSGEIC
jgi:hypothetical protein